MNYKVHREVKDGKLVRLYLGIPEVDAYLDFLKYRCRLNTWTNYAHDLQKRPPTSSTGVFPVLKDPRKGQPLTVGALDTIIKYHRRPAGTPEVQRHRLRQAGMSLEALQAQAGHRSIMSTRVYLHLCPKELQEEYLRLSDSLFMPQGKREAVHE